MRSILFVLGLAVGAEHLAPASSPMQRIYPAEASAMSCFSSDQTAPTYLVPPQPGISKLLLMLFLLNKNCDEEKILGVFLPTHPVYPHAALASHRSPSCSRSAQQHPCFQICLYLNLLEAVQHPIFLKTGLL